MAVKKKLSIPKSASHGIQRTFLGDSTARTTISKPTAGQTADGLVNIYRYVENPDLKILRFPEMSDEWLDFIAKCRAGETHPYDIVEGPMADDTIWDYVNGFTSGQISREAFWALAKFKHPTHQISFHTVNALHCLTFERSEPIHDRKAEK
mgnify:CR=1 FL=1